MSGVFDTDFVAKAQSAWGDDVPEWVLSLAIACKQQSPKAVAQRLGCSRSMISTILANKYSASTRNFEEKVRGALMSKTVECPHLGVIGSDKCLEWRGRANNAAKANRLHIQMSFACQNCPRFTGETS